MTAFRGGHPIKYFGIELTDQIHLKLALLTFMNKACNSVNWHILEHSECVWSRASGFMMLVYGAEFLHTSKGKKMSAYAICDVEIYDLERYQDFVSQVIPAIESAGGRFLVRGGAHEVLEGEWFPRRLVLIEFPSMEKAEGFYYSELYQGLKSNREHWNLDCVIVVEGI